MSMLGFCCSCHIPIHFGTQVFLPLIAFASHPAHILLLLTLWTEERGLMTQGHIAICMQAFSLPRLRGYPNASMQVWCSPLIKACIARKGSKLCGNEGIVGANGGENSKKMEWRPCWQQAALLGGKTKAYSTWYSQAVTHPSTNQARRCLTSVIGREPVFSTWYGRRQGVQHQCWYLYISQAGKRSHDDRQLSYWLSIWYCDCRSWTPACKERSMFIQPCVTTEGCCSRQRLIQHWLIIRYKIFQL